MFEVGMPIWQWGSMGSQQRNDGTHTQMTQMTMLLATSNKLLAPNGSQPPKAALASKHSIEASASKHTVWFSLPVYDQALRPCQRLGAGEQSN